MQKRVSVVLTAVLAVSLFAAQCGSAAASDEPLFLEVAGAAQNSWSYSCMVAIAEAVRQVDPGIDMTIQSTPGSTNHYGMFARGDIDVGTGYTPTDYWANEGTAPLFKESYRDKFYTIVPITISKTQITVRKDSADINSLDDLKGRPIYAGDQAGASTQLGLKIIDTLGFGTGRVVQTDRTEGFNMLRERRVDAIMGSQGVPYAAILELASAVDLKILPFSDEEIAKCMATGPYCFPGEITHAEYDFVPADQPVKTLTQVQNINVRADLEDEAVYRLTKAIVEAWPQVVKTVAAAGRVDPLKDVTKTVTKIHPGAIKYYEERGVVIPPELKP